MGDDIRLVVLKSVLNVVTSTVTKAMVGRVERRRTSTDTLADAILRVSVSGETVTLVSTLELPALISARQVGTALSTPVVEAAMLEAAACVLVEPAGAARSASRKNVRESILLNLPIGESVAAADARNEAADRVTDAIFVILSAKAREFADEEPNFLEEFGRAARQSHIQAIVASVEGHQRTRSQFAKGESLAQLSLWSEEYRRVVANRHRYIIPPDFRSTERFEYDSLYVPPRISLDPAADPHSALDVDVFSERISCSVLLGDPGGGKSTLAENLVRRHALDASARLPFLVVLRDVLAEDSQGGDASIVEWLERRAAAHYQCKPPKGSVNYVFATGQAMVVFDGLDELLDASRRRDVTRIIENFASRYPLTKILVTSRSVGYGEAPLDSNVFEVFTLRGFSSADVDAYAKNWFTLMDARTAPGRGSSVDEFLEDVGEVPDLAASPLMLALLCILYRSEGSLPRNRPAVYEKCANLLFDTWDSHRRINPQLAVKSQVELALRHVAYWMYTDVGEREAVLETDLVREVAEYLRGFAEDESDRDAAAQEFVDFCKGRAWVLTEAGTTPEGEALFRFTHRTFLEYFAACELKRRLDGPERLASALMPHVLKGEWEVVAAIAVQLENRDSKNGADRVVQKMLNDRRRMSAVSTSRLLAFMARLLGVVVVSPATVREVVSRAVEGGCANFLLGPGRVHAGALGEDASGMQLLLQVTPESRVHAAEALGESCLALIESGDDRKQYFGRNGLLAAVMTTTGRNRAFWLDWMAGFVVEHRSEMLPPEASAGEAWKLALLRGYVTMDEYLAYRAKFATSLLDPTLTQGASTPFAFGFLSWFEIYLRQCSRNPSEELPGTIAQYDAAALSFLANIDVATSTPWMDGVEAQPLMFERARGWEEHAKESLGSWRMLVLLALFVELGGQRDHPLRAGEEADDGLTARLRQMRSKPEARSERAVSEILACELLAGLNDDQRAWTRHWIGSDISIVG